MPKLSKRRMPFGQNGSDGSNRWQKKQEEEEKKKKKKKKRTSNIISKYPMNTQLAGL